MVDYGVHEYTVHYVKEVWRMNSYWVPSPLRTELGILGQHFSSAFALYFLLVFAAYYSGDFTTLAFASGNAVLGLALHATAHTLNVNFSSFGRGFVPNTLSAAAFSLLSVSLSVLLPPADPDSNTLHRHSSYNNHLGQQILTLMVSASLPSHGQEGVGVLLVQPVCTVGTLLNVRRW